MLVYIVGVPGSGKSYKAVYTIFNNFSSSEKAKRDLKKDFENCYTNINEFKFDLVHDTFQFDFDDFFEKISYIYAMYKDKKSDDELIEKCKEFNIYRSLFVIDEAHNYFDKKDPILIWWLSYHRHLFHDIYLITQDLTLIEAKYKAFAEFFYRAKPKLVSMNNKVFVYDYFVNSRMAMTQRAGTEKVPKIDEVFNLYQSGDNVESKNVLIKYYLISFFALLFTGFIFYFVYSHFSSSGKSESKIEVKKENIIVSNPDLDTRSDIESFVDSHYLVFNCSSSVCTAQNYNISLPLFLFSKFINENYIKKLYFEPIHNNFFIYYVSVDNEFFNFILTSRSINESSNDDRINLLGSSGE